MGQLTQTTAELQILVDGCYGGIEMEDNATTQETTATPTQLINFDRDSVSSNCTPAFGSNQITIDVAGDYLVSFSCSFGTATLAEVTMHIRKNGSTEIGVPFVRELSNGDQGVAATHFIATFAATDTVQVWVESLASETLTCTHASLTVDRVG